MNPTLVVARKELRALFQSPVAMLFLGVHQLVVLFAFFSASRFFARNLADVRPLFAWLPLLLIFLTAAVTMRAWAEERKLGTLEVLLTLPVRTRDLVLGKFLASVALVGLALLLTVPLPMMVAAMGPLDLGPVVGGYAGALLLGALYAALGLTVSSRTDNQVVSLMVTLAIGGVLYLIGTDTITALFSTDTAEVLRALGTGSRFASLERGVLDLRDLVYYGALTAFLLALNHAFLEAERLDPGSASGAGRARTLAVITGLVAANALAAVVWMTPVTRARVDLTQHGEYSISPATEQVLDALDERLFLEGYFSERTHPKLAALVPQLRDLLVEYGIAGGDRVEVTFQDPNRDPDLEAMLADRYSVRAIPIEIDDRSQVSVVNSFFHVVVRQGDEYDVLSFQDLIEVSATAAGAFDVRLRNPEYDLTRTIKRVSQDFKPLSAVLQGLPDTARITLFASPATLPETWQDGLAAVQAVGAELATTGGDKVTFATEDPSTDRARQEALYTAYGVAPMAADLMGSQLYWFDLVLEMGTEVERVTLRGAVTEADVRTALESGLRRLVPGQLTRVGLLTDDPEPPPRNPQIPPQFQPPAKQADYRGLEQLLTRTHPVERLTLDEEDPTIPSTVDVLIVAKPGPMSDGERLAVDQYLMRGGRVIALAGRREIQIAGSGLVGAESDGSLADLVEAYGVTVDDVTVLDERNAVFPRPVRERRGGVLLQRVAMEPYPLFPDVRRDRMAADHPALAGLDGFTVPWASPLTVAAPDGVDATVLARTSEAAWTTADTSLDPVPPSGPRAEQVLAVAMGGTFPSAFAGAPAPGQAAQGPRTVLDQSLPDARLVVVGSSEIVGDVILSLSQQPGGEAHAANLLFLTNLVDWAVEDDDLLTIRGSGAFARTLYPMDDARRQAAEWFQYGVALILLGVLVWTGRQDHPADLTALASEVSS